MTTGAYWISKSYMLLDILLKKNNIYFQVFFL